MSPEAKWVDAMIAELDQLGDVEQFVAAGEWTTTMTHSLLPLLANRRRAKVLEILAQDGWDAARLADETGSRTSAIKRLAEEGRALRRALQDAENRDSG